MANRNYKITFVSLRAATVYTLNIGGGSGAAVPLKGAAQPFTSQENGDENVFLPIRTQSGYIRIVDDGKDDNGQSLSSDWWKDLCPATDTERPVTLTSTSGGQTVVHWQGFMQAQNFSGVLYGNPQEREFPVTCALSVLAAEDPDYHNGTKNFAFMLKTFCDTIDTLSGDAVHISNLMVQGGADARQWLLTKVDWFNFADEDREGIMRAKYSLYSVLEDMCRFWGWTARTCATTLYLTCADDATEQNFLSLTRAQLNTLSSASTDTTTGSVVASQTVTLADSISVPIFASTNNEDYKVQGPHRAVVKSDCNKKDTIITFAPQDVREWLGDNYSWQGEDEYGFVGYFTTPLMQSTTQREFGLVKLTSSLFGGFARRQIYPSIEVEDPTVADMILVLTGHSTTQPSVMIETTHAVIYSGGSITLGGTVWRGTEQMQNDKYSIQMRLGIGMSRATAKWWYMGREIRDTLVAPAHGWGNDPSIFNVPISSSGIKSTGFYATIGIGTFQFAYDAIPIPENTYGYIFLDILGFWDGTNLSEVINYEIANLSIKYSRESTIIPNTTGTVRSRSIEVDRVTSKEYSATNTNSSKEEWNANCIFASDNNMEYGYGLLANGSNNIISTVLYGGTEEHPEQHLADRVAAYWATSKRKISMELMANVPQSISGGNTVTIGEISPNHKVSFDGDIFSPISISRIWRDDVAVLSIQQL